MFNLQNGAQRDADFINTAWEKLDKKLSLVAVRSREKLPYTTENGVHDDMAKKDICWWTNGFWAGLMWLMYLDTKNNDYRLTAERSEEILDGALAEYDGLHHDVGFMWHISAGASYRISGSKKSRVRALYAANTLAARYNIRGKFIRAWNGEGNEGFAIIDCMMNIPLLYWASREIGDERYRYIAESHADTTLKYHLREDGSAKHIVSYSTENGDYLGNLSGQGYSVDSSWSRGQAWALYGFTLSYIHTQKAEYLNAAKRAANYFISAVCSDFMPRVDFRAPKEPVMYDSTAAACAACGLLELARHLPENEGRMYYDAAINLLKAIDEHFCDYSTETDSVVGCGTEMWRAEGLDGKGVHIPIIYGDFFYAEALFKLRGNSFLIW